MRWSSIRLARHYAAALASFLTTASCFGAGATTPFTTVEAEVAKLSGGAAIRAFVVGSPVPKQATLELEASGGAYVRLDRAGAAIAFANAVDGANAINIRASLPDTPTGGGITATIDLYVDGVFRQAITLSSKQSWVYRGQGWSNDPGSGMPFKFYNEDRALLTGPPIRRGSVIMLKRDAANTAPRYDIDCIDIEAAPPPIAKPADALSVIDFGAKPDSDVDSQAAIQKCIDQARQQHKTVYLPPGRYKIATEIPRGLDASGVTVRGAGEWHTMLYRQVPHDSASKSPDNTWRSRIAVGTHSVMSDLSIDSNADRRGLGKAGGSDYGIQATGDGWLIDHVWVQHCDADWLTGSNGVIRNCRIADGWGDGINLNNGNKPGPDNVGWHLTAENNFVRNAGDDGLATYSDRGAGGDNSQMVGSTFINNTSVAPYWANCLRIAGGRDVVVRGNLLCDPSANSGLHVGTYGGTGQPLESALIEDNEIRRGGGWNGTDRNGLVVGFRSTGTSNIIIRDNVIVQPRRSAIYIDSTLAGLILQNNRLEQFTGPAILLSKAATGVSVLQSNIITNVREK